MGEIFWKLTTGRFPMPSYEDRLKADERWQVALCVRTLAPPPEAVGGLPP